jgi:hypothetical protein
VFSHNGDRRVDLAQAHTRWQHLVALHEATNTLHRAMRLAPYLLGGMVVAIAADRVKFYYIIDNN